MIYLKNIHKNIFYALIIVAVQLGSVSEVSAKVQAKKERVRMKMYYSKNDAGERLISIGLTAGSGKKMHGLKNEEVILTSTLNDSTFTLATLETDTMGLVNLYIANDYKFPMDENGVSVIEASYNGDATYRSVSKELEISDIELEFTFVVEDSVKYLSILANKIDRSGKKVPVSELDIKIGVQRLYSVLPLDLVETDSDGLGKLEIPDDLPGNAEGELTFVAAIEDHDEFGTVTKSASQGWGVPVSYEVKPLPRQLYTDEAPIWMIAAVFITLLGAWYHFFLSISKLIKLKKSA